MKNKKLKTTLFLTFISTMTISSVNIHSVEASTSPVKVEDTIEIVSTEIKTTEDNTKNSNETEKPSVQEDSKPVQKPTAEEKPEVKQPTTEAPTTEKPTVETIKPNKPSEPSVQPQKPSKPSVPTTEAPTSEAPTKEEPVTSEEPVKPGTGGGGTTNPVPPVEQPNDGQTNPDPQPDQVEPPQHEDDSEDIDKIRPGKFDPDKSGKYYEDLDNQVNKLVTKKIDKKDHVTLKDITSDDVKSEDENKNSKSDKKEKSKVSTLPDTGELSLPVSIASIMLLISGLVLTRKSK